MATSTKNNLREIMCDAWRMFRVTGESFSACLKRSWMVFKLRMQMKTRKVQFFFQKVDGTIRQAFGTMLENVIGGKVKGCGRKPNSDLVVYYDCEKDAFRSFKKFNLIKVVL